MMQQNMKFNLNFTQTSLSLPTVILLLAKFLDKFFTSTDYFDNWESNQLAISSLSQLHRHNKPRHNIITVAG